MSTLTVSAKPVFVVLAVLVVLVVIAAKSIKTIDQAHVGVVTRFGKYRRVLHPGLNVVAPFLDRVRYRIAVQNQTSQLEFAAITSDQAAVQFKATLTYAVTDQDPDTIQLVAFKFINSQARERAMTSAIEAAVREFVSAHLQGEVLGLRAQIAAHAKDTLQEQLAGWGYSLIELSINDISFDPAVMASMSRIVVATNAQKAATSEGAALLIKRTKEAEAEGATIRITAENEATAAKLRGEGLAAFRVALSKGFSDSADILKERGIDTGLLSLQLWSEALVDVVKSGKGNTIFVDGNVATLESTMRRLQAITTSELHDEDRVPESDKNDGALAAAAGVEAVAQGDKR